MNTEPIDLALDTKGLTSNAARNPFPQFYWPFRMPHFKGKDLNSEAKIEKAHVPSRGPVFSTTSRPRRGLVLFGFYGQ